MKDLKHIQSFNEHQENLNISDVSESEKYENIYNTLKNISQYELDGYKILMKVKKKCKCKTEDILKSQSLHKVKEIKVGDRIIYSHTSINDFGISNEDIFKSKKED